MSLKPCLRLGCLIALFIALLAGSVYPSSANLDAATIPVGDSPWGIGVNPTTNHIYVANQYAATVSVIDGATHTVTAAISVGYGPAGVGVNAVTNLIYVANSSGDSVSVIDGATSTVLKTISVGSEPNGIAINPLTNRIYVANYNANTVSVINGATATVVNTIPVGSRPYFVEVNPVTNRVYVSNYLGNSVSVIDASSNTAVATIAVGNGPHGIGVNPVTNRIYVANSSSDTISVINGSTDTVIATFPAGDKPYDIDVRTADNHYYVTNENNNNVAIMDGATDTLISTLPVGTDPDGVAVNPVTNFFYVSNYGSDTVSVLSDRAPGILYATPTGAGDCRSWATTCTLPSALIAAISGDEIWVARGIHYPGSAGQRSAAFLLQNNVAVYGGFAGTEGARDQRDWQANLTILSGDIDANDITGPTGVVTDPANIRGNNAYHVVRSSGVSRTAVLDGFVITAGQANGPSTDGYGGGMFNSSGSPALVNVTFSGNTTTGTGSGGGMFNSSGSPALTNVTFFRNTSAAKGGAIYNINQSSPALVNVTFFGNTAGDKGGAMYNSNQSNPTLVNSILWGDSAVSGSEIFNINSSPAFSYSDIQGCGGSGSGWIGACGVDGGGNIAADPSFVASASGNLRLQPVSPAIDAGSNGAVPAGVATDLDGKSRFVDIPSRPDTGNGTPPIVDLGAYEAAVSGQGYQVYLPALFR